MTGIRVIASNDPVDAAFAAFDAAAIRFHRMYGKAQIDDSPEERAERMRAGQEVVRLWDEWRELFLSVGGEDPRPAA